MWNEKLRKEYHPILMELTAKVNQADRDFVETGNMRAFVEYHRLIEEIKSIKDSILAIEKENA